MAFCPRHALQNAAQHIDPLVALDEHITLVDVGERRLRVLYAHMHVVAHKSVRELSNSGRHRRREHERLSLWRQARQDHLHVIDKPHVEHLVGLVHDADHHFAQVENAPVHEVEEPPGRPDKYVDPVFDRRRLNLDVLAPYDCEQASRRMAGEFRNLLGHLDSNFTRRRDDERLGTLPSSATMIRSSATRPYAAVLPLPVCACPRTSFPSNPKGIAPA